MSVSEYEDVALRYAGFLPDGTDVEYTTPPYRVHPPLGDVVAEQGKEIAALRENGYNNTTELIQTQEQVQFLESRLAALEKYRDYMDAQYRTLSGYIATMGQELLDRIDLETTKSSNFATFMGERFGDIESRLAHVERLLHKAINAKCIDDYGDEVSA